jgi:hypothetical protein
VSRDIIDIVQTKWHIQLRMLTHVELMAQERDWLQGLEPALAHELLPASAELLMKKMDHLQPVL